MAKIKHNLSFERRKGATRGVFAAVSRMLRPEVFDLNARSRELLAQSRAIAAPGVDNSAKLKQLADLEAQAARLRKELGAA